MPTLSPVVTFWNANAALDKDDNTLRRSGIEALIRLALGETGTTGRLAAEILFARFGVRVLIG